MKRPVDFNRDGVRKKLLAHAVFFDTELKPQSGIAKPTIVG